MQFGGVSLASGFMGTFYFTRFSGQSRLSRTDIENFRAVVEGNWGEFFALGLSLEQPRFTT